jgi:multidrug efflux pump subunit AcrA (membrane-fusion protein)
MTKQLRIAMLTMLVMTTAAVQAQTTDMTAPAAKTKKKIAKVAAVESEDHKAIVALEEKEAAQQTEIDELKAANAAKDAALAAAQSSATSAQSQADAAAAQAQAATAAAQSQADAVTGLKSTVTDLQNANVGLATTISSTKSDLNDEINSPPALHYKGITITPGGFFAFEGVWRQHSVNSDINTPLNSIPFPSANEGHVSELNFSGRQSRLSGLFQGNTGNFTLTGYAEMDFLGTGTSSNNNQSNSYVLRQRQIWGQAAAKSGFTVTGGQMWSLVTEDRKGTDARTEIQPQTIDPQYLVGYSWTRQPEIRVQQKWGNYKTGALSVAASAEQAQITNFTASGTVPNQYFFGGLGQNGGLYNAAASAAGTPSCTSTASSATPPVVTTTCTLTTSNITTYANNVAPDVVVKAAVDFSQFHAEVGGLARFLRDEYFPVTTTGSGGTPVYAYGPNLISHTSDAGGVFASARTYIGAPGTYPAVEIAAQIMAGTGVGRYGSSQLADATLKPNETLEPIRNYHGLFSIETHPSAKWDVFGYYGGEYAQRTFYMTSAGNLIGYAPTNLSNAGCYNLPVGPTTTIGNAGNQGSLSASSCSEPTKYIEEGMLGFQYRPITSPKWGKLQYSVTYQIINRQLWGGTGSATTPGAPRAQDSMIHVQMRYYIP